MHQRLGCGSGEGAIRILGGYLGSQSAHWNLSLWGLCWVSTESTGWGHQGPEGKR